MVGGSMISPKAPLVLTLSDNLCRTETDPESMQGVYDQEVAMMGDEVNPPPVTYHQR